MGEEEETKTEVLEAVANGTSLLEKSGEAVADKTEKENNGVKEMEEDKKGDEKVETEKMDEDQQVKEDNESKEEKEEPKTDPKENEKKAETEENKDEVDEKVDGLKEEEKAEGSKEEKGTNKLRKVQNVWEKVKGKTRKVEEKKLPEQRTPLTDRPVRERKSVERLVASVDKDASREFQIEKGCGTPLKDIPNVAFKLSRRKTDDTFRLLHTILFGRRGKAVQIKGNISRFSGFVWHENEEKQKIKVKEKFDKCNKEKLLEFCDVLDVPITKITTRKEDIIAKLIDFLEAPHATTTILLAEKDKSSKGKKRKRVTKSTSKRTIKSRRKSDDTPKSAKRSAPYSEDQSEEEEKEEEENEEKNEIDVTEKSEDELPEDSESEEKKESEEDVRKKKKSSKVSSRKKESAGKTKTKKVTVPRRSTAPQKRTPITSASKSSKADEDSGKSPKVSSRKKTEKVTKGKFPTPMKSASKEKTSKKVAKGKDKAKEEKLKPSDYELRAAICEILKEVDFNTATFTDILKRLAQQFDTDLTASKSSIKLIIQEELTKLTDDEDGEGDAEKDETSLPVEVEAT